MQTQLQSHLSQRINITLPQSTVRLMRRAIPEGARSRFIDEAVRAFIDKKQKLFLKKALEKGYIARAKDNLRIAKEWLPLENEVWTRLYQD